ncbi:FAD:protein FMN transferase [Nocardioides stalactiti]|uniref:FAD:protein FMN transferase n=1 Tax=Nocardioides stalactiti TaxID=2755356 RepID=UPI001C8160D5|nr:FAD:protein FMN transferase [Nocardioides stalactiti]
MRAPQGQATPSGAADTWRAVEQLMGMPVSVALRGRHAGSLQGRRTWQEAVAFLRTVDADYSPFRQDSWVTRVDRGEEVTAAPATLALDPAEVLGRAAAAKSATGGAFDVWRTGADGRRHFDPSGVVKGLAVQRAAVILQQLPDTDVCLNGGGDVSCWMARPHGAGAEEWRIGVEDPFSPSRLLAHIPVRRGAVATSGLAHRGAHVRDARTGLPPRHLAAVTVVADDLVDADVAATCALALDSDGPQWLRDRDLTALVVRRDGSAELIGARPS